MQAGALDIENIWKSEEKMADEGHTHDRLFQ